MRVLWWIDSDVSPPRLFMFGCVSSGLTNIMFGFLPNIESGPVFLGLSLLIRSLTAVGGWSSCHLRRNRNYQ